MSPRLPSIGTSVLTQSCEITELCALLYHTLLKGLNMKVDIFDFPTDPRGVGYSLFPAHLENDSNVFFHGTASVYLSSILERGFIPSPPLDSVSFSMTSPLALGYACSKRSPESPEGCVIVVRYDNINRPGIVLENSILYDYTRIPPPVVIGYCIVPATYNHV